MIFYSIYKVLPEIYNRIYHEVESAYAQIWVSCDSAESAHQQALVHLGLYDWKLVSIENYPQYIPKEYLTQKELAPEKVFIDAYFRAERESISSVIIGEPRDGKTTSEAIPLESSYEGNLQESLNRFKAERKKGQCLHFQSSSRCKIFINAHSIQKSGALTEIAKDGHILQLSSDVRFLKESGKLGVSKVGINKASTFLGFCAKHDNELFESIDNFVLEPTKYQISLYAYRSLCRELYIKEAAFNSLSKIENDQTHAYVKKFYGKYKDSTKFGLDNLKRHKLKFDESLSDKTYSDIKYYIFVSESKANLAFSGAFYPVYDFQGNLLQDLSKGEEFDLLTFSSAPTELGWAFIFAWHKTSSSICELFIESLEHEICKAQDTGDLLFRFLIGNCENYAMSPCWWHRLSKVKQQSMIDYASTMSDLLSVYSSDYLQKGIEGISEWTFKSILKN